MVSKSKIVTDGDPLAYVLAPPPNESEEQRQTRLAAEAEAKRISDAIDEELQRQAKAEKRAPRTVKILLLGESSHLSGANSMLNSYSAYRSERVWYVAVRSWKYSDRVILRLFARREIDYPQE